MYRGTTPTLVFNLSQNKTLDLNNVDQIWVTLKNSTYTHNWDKDSCDIDTENKKISITLTQEETLALPVSKVQAQIRILLTNGKALATNIVTMDVKSILKEGVIE